MPSISKEKIRVVYPPCDVDSLSVISGPVSRKERPVNSSYIFLSMNRFWPEKRLEIILEAAGMFFCMIKRYKINVFELLICIRELI